MTSEMNPAIVRAGLFLTMFTLLGLWAYALYKTIAESNTTSY